MNEQNCFRCGVIVIALTILVMLSFFFNTYLVNSPSYSSSVGVKPYKIWGASMQPTLLVGDHMVIDLHCYAKADPGRGDLVVFKHPENPSKDYIKRIVAIPGDTFELRGNRIFINGGLVEEPYVQYSAGKLNIKPLETVKELGPFEVPKDKYFMLGDNRDQSIDSRSWGYIDRKLIEGKVMFVYWSGNFDRIGAVVK